MIIDLFLMFSAFNCGLIWAWIIWGNPERFMKFYKKQLTNSEEKE